MIKTNLSSFDNAWYVPGSKIKIIIWFFVNALVLRSPVIPSSFIKVLLLRFFGAKVGKGVIIKPSVNIKYPWKLRIGNNTWIGEDVWIDNLADIVIGDNVCISQGAMLLCGNHNYKKSTFDLIIRDIVLEDGVWIGAKSVVCPGSICKSHSVLSVGSVLSSTMQAYSIYRGNPASFVKQREIL